MKKHISTQKPTIKQSIVGQIKSLLEVNKKKYMKNKSTFLQDDRVLLLSTLEAAIDENMSVDTLRTVIMKIEQIEFKSGNQILTLAQIMQKERTKKPRGDKTPPVVPFTQFKPFQRAYWSRHFSSTHFDTTLIKVHALLKSIPVMEYSYPHGKKSYIETKAITDWITPLIKSTTEPKKALRDFSRDAKINGRSYRNKDTQTIEKTIHTFTNNSRPISDFMLAVGGQDMNRFIQLEFMKEFSINDNPPNYLTSTGTINWVKQNGNYYCDVNVSVSFIIAYGEGYVLNEKTSQLDKITLDQFDYYGNLAKLGRLPNIFTASTRVRLDIVDNKATPRVVKFSVTSGATNLIFSKMKPTTEKTVTITTEKTEKPPGLSNK